MASIDEIFDSMTYEETSGEVETTICVIDPVTRVIAIPASQSIAGVESDDDAVRRYFSIPCTFGECDFSEFNIYINYMNAAGDGGVYIVPDATSVDGELHFSWLIDRQVFAIKGNISFIVCFKRINTTSSTVVKEFNTTVAQLSVLEGLEVEAGEPTTEQATTYDQLLAIMQNAATTASNAAATAATNAAALAAVAAAEQVRDELRDDTLELRGVTTITELCGAYLSNGSLASSAKWASMGGTAVYARKNSVISLNAAALPDGKAYSMSACMFTSSNISADTQISSTMQSPSLGLTSYTVPMNGHVWFGLRDNALVDQTDSDRAAVLSALVLPTFYGEISVLEDIDKLASCFDDSQNLLDPSKVVSGYYMSSTGTVKQNVSYCYSGNIPVNPGDTLQSNATTARYVTCFNSSGTVVSASGMSSVAFPITIPSGIYSVVLTVPVAFADSNWMVNTGDSLLPYNPFGNLTLKSSSLPSIPVEKISGLKPSPAELLLGNDSVSTSAGSLASGASITLQTAPRFVKKNVGLTFFAKFASFSELTIGKGYNSYRGKSVVINGTTVTMHSYDVDSDTASAAVEHGLTISEYIQVSMYMASDGICRVNINTLGGSFSTEMNFGFEWNYAPFVTGLQNMTGVKFASTTSDLMKPMWLFGDSYFGVSTNRVMGQLKNLGFFDFLVDAIAGMRSTNDGNKDAKAELERLLAFCTPKYLVWCEGLNGGNNNTIDVIPWLKETCADKDITLILYVCPSVPGRDTTSLNDVIRASGCRYIDGYTAVVSSTGSWYNGYLDPADNVHPTELGAKALAMRYVVDVPEIMQYGYSASEVTGSISGDA